MISAVALLTPNNVEFCLIGAERKEFCKFSVDVFNKRSLPCVVLTTVNCETDVTPPSILNRCAVYCVWKSI